ncbi:MAG: adenosine kinase [Bacteroidaceae bacterium]|nr:adenosine kinase [Bacteroidaceae bacterium]
MKRITGIGNALTDVLAQVSDENVLSTLALPKGSMQLIDDSRLPDIRRAMLQMTVSRATGGSTGNTMLALANLGASPTFIGKVGDDETGRFYAANAASKGIRPLLIKSQLPSGIAHTFITPDGERTFATYLGAAGDMQADDLNETLFADCDYLYIEGYLVQNHALIRSAIEMAKAKGAKVALDLASYNIVEADHAFFAELLTKYVDVVFANEEEARAFTGKEAEEALIELGKLCEIAVVKMGKRGSAILYQGERTFVESMEVSHVIDTTGAGDFYAAGVMYGLLNDWNMERCAQAGSLLAGHVIQVIGTTLPEEVWEEIRTKMKNEK